MSALRWYQKDGLWRTRCGRFAIEQCRRGVKLHDACGGSRSPYVADTTEEAKQLAKRISTQRK